MMKYYYYKGVKLPDIDTVWTDKETYPYAFIHTTNNVPEYYLTLCAYLPVYTDDRGLHTRNVFKRYVTNNRTVNDVPEVYWEFGYERNDPNEAYYTGLNVQLAWTNSDILYDGRSTIYLAASKPISDGEYGMIPLVHYEAACDAIRAKNGKTDLIKSEDMASEIKKPSQFRKKLIDRSLDGELKKEDLEGVTSIGYYAFANCKIESADIPDTVISIDSHAFSECFKLRKVTLPNRPLSIQAKAFMNCMDLTEIILPDNVSYIGEWAFSGCTSLQSIALPSGINTINENVFTACEALSNITIPNTVTNIGKNAFRNCTSLTTIDLPKNITEIASSAFSGCTNLKTIYADWEEGKVAGAPWGATNATVVYTRYQEPVIIDKRDAAARLIVESLDAVTLNGGYYFPYGQAYAKLAAVGNIVKATSGEIVGFDGWIGFGKEILAFGVGVAEPGSDLSVDNMFWGDFKKPTEDGVLAAGGQYASRYLIPIPTEGVDEPMTVDVTWLALLEGNMIVKIHTVTLQVSVPETE